MLYSNLMQYRTLHKSSIYICKDYNIFLYPDPNTAARSSSIKLNKALSFARVATEDNAVTWAEFWSRRLEKDIDFCKQSQFFIALQTADKFVPVLTENKIRWIISENWLSLKEIHLKH